MMKIKIGSGELVSRMLDRQFLMGCAIIFIWLYHMRCTCHVGNIVFAPGFIGVDFFFFLSGYGLCYSWQKNDTGTFYKNRFKRVYPLFLILAVSYTAMSYFYGKNPSLWDWFCNMTAISYFGVGGSTISWYLTAQIVFYIVFPVLFRLIVRWKYIPFLVSLVLSLLAVSIIDMHWRYDCFVSRVPIFMAGILFYQYRDKVSDKDALRLSAVSLGLGGVILLLGIPSFFYLVSTFAIPLMLCCIHLEKRLHQRFLNHAYSVISWCGRKSLEIYVGHSIGRYVIKHFLTTSDYILLYYVVFTILFTFIVDSLNKGIQRMV